MGEWWVGVWVGEVYDGRRPSRSHAAQDIRTTALLPSLLCTYLGLVPWLEAGLSHQLTALSSAIPDFPYPLIVDLAV